LFDNLDEELDGWLIKSENFQALNTILPKFKGKVQTIYIDPPYNTGSDEFIYMDRYRHSTWLTMMENRLSLAKELMKEDGVIFVSIGDLDPQNGESFRLQMLMSEIFEKRFGNLIWEKRHSIGSYSEKNMTEIHEYILVFGKEKARLFHNILNSEDLKEYKERDNLGPFKWTSLIGPSQQTKYRRPNLYYAVLYCEKEDKIVGVQWGNEEREIWHECQEDLICIYPPNDSTWLISKEKFKEYSLKGLVKVSKGKVYLKKHLYDKNGEIRGKILKSILVRNGIDVGTNMTATRELKDMFSDEKISSIHPKPVNLIKLLVKVSTKQDDIILDFFAGSGTTMEAVLRLNFEDFGKRKFILIETGETFYSLILPRLKKLSYSLEWKGGKPISRIGLSIFTKYYELEQIEDILSQIVYMYEDDYCFFAESIFKTSLKHLFLCEISSEFDSILLDINKFSEIFGKELDVFECVSINHGKFIKKIYKDKLILEDNYIIYLNPLKAEFLKSFLWWR
ncbi:MAG: site-specific DNA-methyltransferase, partial [Candidatus Micrarchaeia archaeon]